MTAKHTGLGQPMAPPGETPATPLSPTFFARDTSRVARELLGQLLVRRIDATTIVARIVETEAYLGAEDRASHAWAGRRSARNAALYLPPGTAYVYFIYGMHFCLNVVANTDGGGGAVLFRAAEVVCPPALRPGVVILLAMLAAPGTSVLRNVYVINRGYEDLAERLTALGAKVDTFRDI